MPYLLLYLQLHFDLQSNIMLKLTPCSFSFLVHKIALHIGSRLPLKETAPKTELQISITHAQISVRLWTYDPSIRELQTTCLRVIRWYPALNQMNSSSRCNLCKRQKGKKQLRLPSEVNSNGTDHSLPWRYLLCVSLAD